jgi:hypothetical protein
VLRIGFETVAGGFRRCSPSQVLGIANGVHKKAGVENAGFDLKSL